MMAIAGTILFISFILLLLVGAPIAIAIILSSVITFSLCCLLTSH